MESEPAFQPLDGQQNETQAEIERYVRGIHGQSLQWLAEYHGRHIEIEHEITTRWGKALDAFDLLILVCQRALTSVDQQTKQHPTKQRDDVLLALFPNAVRACQIAKEVRTLLGTGYATGASTRWRTLHEIHVVVSLIEANGAVIARRYLDHAVVQSNKNARATERAYSAMGQSVPPSIAEAIAGVRVEYQEVRKKYAGDKAYFQRDYGWASGFAANTTFADLEQAANLSGVRGVYGLVSGNIHPGIAGAFADSVTSETGEMLMLGPVADGLEPPLLSTAITLIGITRILLRHVFAAYAIEQTIKRDWAFAFLALIPLYEDVRDAMLKTQ